MKFQFMVEIDIPEDFVVDASADVEAIHDAVWEMFPSLPFEAISVQPYREALGSQGVIFAGPGPDDMGPA